MEKIPLRLDPNGPADARPRAQSDKHPLMGYFAVGFGVLGIFTNAVFTVMGLFCSIIALFLGQVTWAVVGLFLAIAGIVTSPIILGLIGLGFFYKEIARFLHLPWF